MIETILGNFWPEEIRLLSHIWLEKYRLSALHAQPTIPAIRLRALVMAIATIPAIPATSAIPAAFSMSDVEDVRLPSSPDGDPDGDLMTDLAKKAFRACAKGEQLHKKDIYIEV